MHRTENLKYLICVCKSKFPLICRTFPHVFCTVTLGVRPSPPPNFCDITELTVSPESCNRRHLRTKLNIEVYSHCVNVRNGPKRRWLRRWNVESAEAVAALISSQPLPMSISNPPYSSLPLTLSKYKNSVFPSRFLKTHLRKRQPEASCQQPLSN